MPRVDAEAAVADPGAIDRLNRLLLALAAGGLVLGLALRFALPGPAAHLVWTAATLPVLTALVVEIAQSLRRGEVGLDIVAALSMSAALPWATRASGLRSTGEMVSKVSPSAAGTALPPIWFVTPSSRKRSSCCSTAASSR